MIDKLPPITNPIGGQVTDPESIFRCLEEGTGLVFGMRISSDGDSIILESADPRLASWYCCHFDHENMEVGRDGGKLVLTPRWSE